jgi:hypothetical protein
VRPGGAVGLLVVCAVVGVVVGLPGGVVGDPVTGVVGTTVGVGTMVGVAEGTVVACALVVGVLVGVGVVSLGRNGSTAAGPGVMCGRGADLAASGSGISGVSSRGPPSRLLAMRIKYPTAGTASTAPARRMAR